MSEEIKIKKGKKVEYSFVDTRLLLKNELTFAYTGRFVVDIMRKLKRYKHSVLVIDLSGIKEVDSSGVTAIYYIKDKMKGEGVDIIIEGGSESVNNKLDLFAPKDLFVCEKPEKVPFFERVGSIIVYYIYNYFLKFISLSADIFFWSVHDIFTYKSRRKGEVVKQAVKIGVNATLIVMVMTFIIGLVLALHSATQLRNYGANIFIVDLIVIAIMAQMGPLITAILVAGRSGSSIAAEIATMKVTSEIDALKTMGFNPVRFVVVPKIYGCLLTIPFLVILANVAGIAGGMVAANMFLDITPEIFINRMATVMQNKDIVTGFIKSIVYGCIIVTTGSFYGFGVKQGAEGVGRSTTIAVVVSISLVIIADSIMGLIFY